MRSPPQVELRPMDAREFSEFREHSSREYARVSPHYRDLPAAEALDLVLNDFDRRLGPEGHETAGAHFLAIFHEGRRVGYLHLSEYPPASGALYAWNFFLDEGVRGQGLGRAAMEAGKDYFRARGFKKIALNVIAENRVAISLYEKFGFAITQMNMETRLD